MRMTEMDKKVLNMVRAHTCWVDLEKLTKEFFGEEVFEKAYREDRNDHTSATPFPRTQPMKGKVSRALHRLKTMGLLDSHLSGSKHYRQSNWRAYTEKQLFTRAIAHGEKKIKQDRCPIAKKALADCGVTEVQTYISGMLVVELNPFLALLGFEEEIPGNNSLRLDPTYILERLNIPVPEITD